MVPHYSSTVFFFQCLFYALSTVLYYFWRLAIVFLTPSVPLFLRNSKMCFQSVCCEWICFMSSCLCPLALCSHLPFFCSGPLWGSVRPLFAIQDVGVTESTAFKVHSNSHPYKLTHTHKHTVLLKANITFRWLLPTWPCRGEQGHNLTLCDFLRLCETKCNIV